MALEAETPSPLLDHYKALRAHEVELNRATAELERAVLQLVFLFNGGASVAVFGLLGAWGDRIPDEGMAQIRLSLYAWALGLVFAAAATALAYLSQRYFSQASRQDREDIECEILPTLASKLRPRWATSEKLVDLAKLSQKFWWAFVTISVACFIYGAIRTAAGVAQATMHSITPLPSSASAVELPPSVNALALLFEQASRPAPWLTPLVILAGLGTAAGVLLAISGKDKPIRSVGAALSLASIFGGTAVTLVTELKKNQIAKTWCEGDVAWISRTR